MAKWMCNMCGKMYDFKRDAAMCHPDVVEVQDDGIPASGKSDTMESIRIAGEALKRFSDENRLCNMCGGMGCSTCDGKGIEAKE